MKSTPGKLTEQVQRKILLDISDGFTLSIAAARNGVTRRAVQFLARRDENFERALRIAEGHRQAKWVRGVVRAGEQGDWKAYKFLLQSTVPEFRARVEVQHQVQQGVQRVYEELQDHMSEAAYAELTRGLAILAGVGEEVEREALALEAGAGEAAPVEATAGHAVRPADPGEAAPGAVQGVEDRSSGWEDNDD